MNKKKVTRKKEVVLEKKTEKSPVILVRYIIHRFELNDTVSPSYYTVGFKVVCDINQRESYIETPVDYKDCSGKSDNEICSIAYEKLKNKIVELESELLKKKFIVGSEFVPPQ